MKNIRRGIFETNSSSSHSISIADSDGILDTIIPDDNGNIVLTGGEFGGEWKRINDPLIKANYCAVDVQDDPDKLSMLRNVIMDHTGCNDVIFRIEGYIDHQSVGNSSKAFTSYETLKNCIFNPNSYIFTGNDSSYAPPNFYDVGREFHYKYRLEMDGTNLVELFENFPNKDNIRNSIYRIIKRHDLTKHNYDLYTDCTDYKGNKFDSLTRMEQGIILLFKLKDVYEEDNQDKYRSKYLGYKIIDIKEINFRIVELQKRSE
jgi:hypothetical protein